MRFHSLALAAALAFPVLIVAQNARPTGPPTVAEARVFLDSTNAELLKLESQQAQGDWVGETHITDDTEALDALVNQQYESRALELVKQSHRFDKLILPADLRRQMMLLQITAPAAPSDPKLLEEATTIATQLTGMYGKGKYCPPNAAPDSSSCLGIDDVSAIMAKSRDPEELKRLWIGWHAIGAPMHDKYAREVELENIGARELGYKDTGELWRAGYDMKPAEFAVELDRAWGQLEPLYRELHTYVRRKLIAKYGAVADRPDGLIPGHLLGNMWSQDWSNIYDLVAPDDPRLSNFKMFDLDAALRKQIAANDPEAAKAFDSQVDPTSDAGHAAQLAAGKDMVHYGENFFLSLGFAKLPDTFWQRSQFVHPRDAEVVCHASAWDVDNVEDLRVKLCVQANAEYFTTVHHELGHNFYQRAYNKQPMLFRNGANDGFHEAIGDTLALAITPDYLKQLKLIDTVPPPEADIPLQLRTALEKIAFLPFGLVLDKWRWQVFSGEIKPADYNKAWWALRAKYQGVAPPVERTEKDFDAGAKNHIPTNVPYARYFLAAIYEFQFYKAMCDESGYKGPLNRCTFYGSKAAGAKFNHMLETGQSQPWQKTLKEMTGTDHLDAQPMFDYFAPLYTWLKQQNAAAK